MKRTEIELIAKQLVKYVEDNPRCSRGDVCMSIDAKVSTVQAWNSIKHLFDYGRYDGCRIKYTRNKLPYSYKAAKTPVKGVSTRQPSWINQLLVTMQKIVDENQGINGDQIRNMMQLDNQLFKRVSVLLKAERRRAWRTMTYYPLGHKFTVEPPKLQLVRPFKYTAIAKTDLPILTVWQTPPPWMGHRANP